MEVWEAWEGMGAVGGRQSFAADSGQRAGDSHVLPRVRFNLVESHRSQELESRSQKLRTKALSRFLQESKSTFRLLTPEACLKIVRKSLEINSEC